MAAAISQGCENSIREIAISERFNNFELKIKTGALKGDNYMGEITIVDINENNSDKTLSLIIKSASTNEEFRKFTPIAKVYQREIYMYETIFPEFDKLQNECNVINKFSSYPKIYGSNLEPKNEYLILENLKEIGYGLWDRHKPMNIEHIEFVFKEYGKYHALSMGLKELKPELYEKIAQNVSTNIIKETKSKEDLQKNMTMLIKQGFDAVQHSEKATKALQRFSNNLGNLLGKDLEDKTHAVIIHGDCWCNNMLFKYDEENSTKPTSMSFLDFQVIMTGLPARDLSHFLFVNTTRNVYSNDKKFLNIYYDSFSQMLTELGCDPKKIFTYDDLINQWKKICPFGMYIAMAILKIILSKSEQAPDLQVAAENGNDMLDIFTKEFGNKELYSQRICDLLEFLSDSDYV